MLRKTRAGGVGRLDGDGAVRDKPSSQSTWADLEMAGANLLKCIAAESRVRSTVHTNAPLAYHTVILFIRTLGSQMENVMLPKKLLANFRLTQCELQ